MRRFTGTNSTRAMFFLAASLLVAAPAPADVYTWNFDANGDWSTAGNWTSTPGDYPNSNTADAQIGVTLTTTRTLTLTENVVVNAIRLTSPTTSPRLEVSPLGPYTFTFGGANPVIHSTATAGGHAALRIWAPVIVGSDGVTKTGAGSAAFMNAITGSGTLTFAAGTTELSGASSGFTGEIVINNGAIVQARAFSGTGSTVLGDTTGVTIINGTGQFYTRDSSNKTISEDFVLNGIKANGSLRCFAGGENTFNGSVTLNSDSSFGVADWSNNGVGTKRNFYINNVIADANPGDNHRVYFIGDLSATSAQGTQGRLSEMILGAVSTYGGNTYLTTNKADNGSGTFSGTLRLGIDYPLPIGTTLTIGGQFTSGSVTLGTGAGNGRFVLNGHSQELAGLLANGTGPMNRVVGNSSTLSTLTLNIAAATTNTYDGYLGWTDTDDNNLALVKTGLGTLELTAANTYEGTTSVNAGILKVTNPTALGSSAAGSGTTVANNATVQVAGGVSVAEPITITGGGVLAPGSWFGALRSMSDGNTWSGPIVLGASSRIGMGTAGTFNLTGGITEVGTASVSFVGTGGSTIRIAVNPVNITGGLLAIDNNITLLDVGGNVWGSTTISYGGTLKLGLDDAMPATTVVTIGSSNNTNGTLDLNSHSQTIAGLTDLGTGTRRVVSSGGGTPTLTVNNTSDYTYAGVLGVAGQAAFGLEKTGTATLTLSGDNAYTGATLVDQGTLRISSSTALGATTAGTTVNQANSARLELTGGINVAEPLTLSGTASGLPWTLRNVSGDNELSGPVNLTGNIRMQSTSGSLQFSGGVTGTNTFFVVNSTGGSISFTTNPINIGSGTFWADSGGLTVLGVAGNTWGGTTFTSGTLRMGVADALPHNTAFQHSGLSYGTGGTLDLNGFDQTIASLYTGPNLANATGSQITSATPATLTINQNNTTTYAGGLTGALSLVKSGTGTLNLTGAAAPAGNQHTGDTVVNGGTLAIGNVGILRNSTLDTGPAGSQQVAFTVVGTNTYNLGGLKGSDDLAIGGNTISVGANGQDTTFSGAITGTGGALTKVGGGTLTLAGDSTYTGPTTVNAGTLRVNGSITSNVTVAGGWLDGTGTVNGDVDVQAAGSVSAGNSPGHFHFTGNYTQSGTMLAELGGEVQGDSYDWIEVDGTATLGGTVDVNFFGTFGAADVAVGDFFDVLTAADGIANDDLSGVQFDFSGAQLQTAATFWQTEIVPWGPTGGPGEALRLSIGVPEPSSLLLGALGLLGAGLCGWRRRRPARRGASG